ncbi:MAG: tetratricopeptide repeat protein [Novosphingobium sp.]
MTIFAALLSSTLAMAQVGPFTVPNPGGNARVPKPALEGREARPKPVLQPVQPVVRPALSNCYALAADDPVAALTSADDDLTVKTGAERNDALGCRAIALLALERFNEAETAFIAARDALDADDARGRAEYMAGAAIAAEGRAAYTTAIDYSARAKALAKTAEDAQLAGRISRDSAGTLFKLGRKDEAAAALAEARAALPTDPITFTISARAARLSGKLAEAQAFIELAARLDPLDVGIGLEAGLIAAMGGRDDAARKSWRSVIATAPQSAEAEQAKAWIARLDAPAPAPPKAK